MRVLATSDWQADYSNLDTLKIVVDEILRLKEELGFDVLVHCGDVKQVYSPIDVRMLNFVIYAIGKLKKAGLEVIICLGNHDRVGMHVDRQNWFPVLRRAGALAYDQPHVTDIDGFKIHVLPFRNDLVLLKREASDLAAQAHPEKSVLIFHSELASCKFNVLSRSEAKVRPQDLVPDRYLFCIGGHIHLPQKVAENVFYVGSPFASEWGEANQKKGYLLLDFEKKTLTRVLSKIPGWFDPQWPRFAESKPQTWKGARVRIKVPVADVRRVAEELKHAKEKAEKTYQGAEILVIPEFKESSIGSNGIRADWPDKKKIESYTKTTLSRPLQPYRQKTVAYLIEQLEQAGGLMREGGELEFKSVQAQNFLSFKTINWSVQPGLHVITGKNRDWNRSNGAGKTSWLQPIAVALFGSTFKGQKHDRWVRRGVQGESWVGVTFADNQRRAVVVFRRRLPKPQLMLQVDGETIDSGNRPEQTQKMIEQITGYTWETLSNAVYIDQSRAHLMLTGTEAERKEFLARLQNLERFERAKKQVKDQKTGLEATVNSLQDAISTSEATSASLSQTISQTKQMRRPNSSPEATFRVAEKELAKARDALAAWHLVASRKRSMICTVVEKQETLLERMASERAFASINLANCRNRLESFQDLQGTCPVCEQTVDRNHVEKHIALLKKSEVKYVSLLSERTTQFTSLKALKYGTEKKMEQWDRNKVLEAEVEEKGLARARAAVEYEQAKKQDELLESLRRRKEEAVIKIVRHEERLAKIQKWLSVLDYAEQVFSRSGLPAYLNAQLVPELNQAAAEYSELFAQKEIQVRFQVDEEGRMDVQVVNAHGGEGVQDQSEGEMKMASLITSFAVRQAAPKTNLLILDEPGDGLDPVSAKQFAKGLKELTGKFSTILCVTHNIAILSELGEENRICIIKENGVSKMEET